MRKGEIGNHLDLGENPEAGQIPSSTGLLLAKAAAEIAWLREAVVRYCDRSKMATVEPSEVQQAIDRAFEFEGPQ